MSMALNKKAIHEQYFYIYVTSRVFLYGSAHSYNLKGHTVTCTMVPDGMNKSSVRESARPAEDQGCA